MANEKRYIFLIDDEPIQNEMLKDYLSDHFLYELKIYDNGEDALKDIALKPEIAILDYHLNAHRRDAKNGVEILKLIKEQAPDTQVVMLSGQDKIEVAVDSIKYGAYDYVVKGETAFSRMENIINNISELHKIKTINKGYKTLITILAIVVAGSVALAVYLLLFTKAYNH